LKLYRIITFYGREILKMKKYLTENEMEKYLIDNKKNGDFVGEFAKYRNDLVTSDREAAAFMFALEIFL
jgi:hypothetical protein